MIKIQLSNPIVLNVHDVEDENIEEALQTIFPLDTELAFLRWNYFYIPLSYKYDISIIIMDFIKLYEFIYDDDSDYLLINWTSSSFLSRWDVYKDNDNNIRIQSKWDAVLGNLKGLLNDDGETLINTNELGGEIKKLIVFLKFSLEKNGYNSTNIYDYYLLEKLSSSTKSE
jgi:hypothetical protein